MASLAHYGIKGMKWGIRREQPSSVSDAQGNTVYSRKGRITGVDLAKNAEFKPSNDATRAAAIKTTAQKRSTDALSNKELQDLVTRMNLEQQYSRLTQPSNSSIQKMVTDVLVNQGKQELTKFVQNQAAKQVANALRPKSR